jgi:hypothetical protein
MGLEEFTADELDEPTEETPEQSNETRERKYKDNSPSEAAQAFTDLPMVTPRAIKYQIKSIGGKWVKQFSAKRFDTGEVVMYGYGDQAKQSGKTVAIFTTIQSVVDDIEIEEHQDIHVVCWDLEQREALNNGEYIKPKGEWNKQLRSAIEDQVEHLDQHVDN